MKLKNVSTVELYLPGRPNFVPGETIFIPDIEWDWFSQDEVVREWLLVGAVSPQEVAIPPELIAVTKATFGLTGKTITVAETGADITDITKASILFTGKTVTMTDVGTDSVAITVASVLSTGKTIAVNEIAPDQSFQDMVVASNPVSFYRMNGSTTQTDLMDSSRILTPSSSRAASLGRASFTDDLGGAAKFWRNGSGRLKGNTAAQTALDFEYTSNFSILAHVVHDQDLTLANNSAMTIISNSIGSGNFTGWEFSIRKLTSNNYYLRGEVTIQTGTTGRFATVYGTSLQIPASQVSQVAMTYDGSVGGASGIQLYVDGVLVGTRTAAGTLTGGTLIGQSKELHVGARGSDATAIINGMQGFIGDVVVWDRLLTGTEVASFLPKKRTFAYVDNYPFQASPTSPVKVLYDDDCDSDIDAVNNIAVLSALDKNGKIDLIGAVDTSVFTYSAAAMDILWKDAATRISNSKLGTMPYGVWQGTTGDTNTDNWTQDCVDTFRPTGLRAKTDFTDSTVMYRTVLAAQANNSVVLVVGGTWHAVKALRDSAADGISSLSGWDLMKAKIKYISFCGTQDTNANENNMRFGIAEGRDMFRNSPVPIISAPVEQFTSPAVRVKTASTTDVVNPFRRAYAKWHANQSLPITNSRPIGDIMSILYATNGQSDGFLTIDKWGHTLTFRDNGSVASRSPYPGDQFGLIRKVASDTTIQTAVQALIDQTTGG